MPLYAFPQLPMPALRPLCALLLAAASSLTALAAPPETLALREPLDWQVTQRRSPTQGTLRLAGLRPADSSLEWRLSGQPLQGSLPDAWQALPTAPGPPEFSAALDLPAGGWYRLELRALRQGQAIASASVAHLGIGEVFLVAGQSNSANHGTSPQLTQTGSLASFDGQSWHLGNDPQRGASGDGGSFMPAFGDALAAKLRVPIGVIPLGVGATSVREWLPSGTPVDRLTTTGSGLKPRPEGAWEALGDSFARLSGRLRALGPQGCRAVLWHQGESDAGQARSGYPADRQISGDDYARYMKILVLASRQAAAWPVPWFTSQTTYHSESDPADAEFRLAQKSLWDSGLTLPGPDTDALRAEYRDGVHFNPKGLLKHGQLWAEHVNAWLEGPGKSLGTPP